MAFSIVQYKWFSFWWRLIPWKNTHPSWVPSKTTSNLIRHTKWKVQVWRKNLFVILQDFTNDIDPSLTITLKLGAPHGPFSLCLLVLYLSCIQKRILWEVWKAVINRNKLWPDNQYNSIIIIKYIWKCLRIIKIW